MRTLIPRVDETRQDSEFVIPGPATSPADVRRGARPDRRPRAKKRALPAVLAVALLTVASCAGSKTASRASAVVRPFDDVRASDLVFEPDPNDPSRGIFHVTTTKPMICAIVWGDDTSFGRFNNSLAMNGTGIVQHDVSLPSIEPGVTYSYVVEGVTADGTLYRSDMGTFQIGTEGSTTSSVSVAVPGTNVATRASVTQVSSEFSSAFAASNAIDDDTTTEWATRGDGDNASITLDLGSTVDIAGFDFVTRSMADGTAITSTYTVSLDGAVALGPFPASTPARPSPQSVAGRGRVVRFDISQSSGGNVGAIEIRVFG